MQSARKFSAVFGTTSAKSCQHKWKKVVRHNATIKSKDTESWKSSISPEEVILGSVKYLYLHSLSRVSVHWNVQKNCGILLHGHLLLVQNAALIEKKKNISFELEVKKELSLSSIPVIYSMNFQITGSKWQPFLMDHLTDTNYGTSIFLIIKKWISQSIQWERLPE